MEIEILKLQRTIISELENAQRTIGALETTITNRIDYIIRQVHKTLKIKLHAWYCDDEYNLSIDSKTIDCESIESNIRSRKPIATIITNDGSEWNFDRDGIPTRWLFEDFEKELRRGKEMYDERAQIQKADALIKSSKEQALVNRAKTKLSKAELKALKKSMVRK